MKEKVIWIALVGIVLVALIRGQGSQCPRLSCLTGLDAFMLGNIYQENNHLFRAQYMKGGISLRAEMQGNVGGREAQQEMAGFVGHTRSLYEVARAPYPGEVSQVVSCDKKFAPTIEMSHVKEKDSRIVINGVMSKRQTFGVCERSDVGFMAQVILLYCSQKNVLFKLAFLVPIEKAEMLSVPTVVCK